MSGQSVGADDPWNPRRSSDKFATNNLRLVLRISHTYSRVTVSVRRENTEIPLIFTTETMNVLLRRLLLPEVAEYPREDIPRQKQQQQRLQLKPREKSGDTFR